MNLGVIALMVATGRAVGGATAQAAGTMRPTALTLAPTACVGALGLLEASGERNRR